MLLRSSRILRLFAVAVIAMMTLASTSVVPAGAATLIPTEMRIHASYETKMGQEASAYVDFLGWAMDASSTVTFAVDGVDVDTVPISVGGLYANFNWVPVALGVHTISARYSGDAIHEPAVAPPVNVTVTPGLDAPVLVKTGSFTTGVHAGLPAGFDVSMSQGGTADGTRTIAMTLDGNPLPNVVIPARKQTASFKIPALIDGAHTLTATYAGDTLYAGGSSSQTFTVGRLAAIELPGSPYCPPDPKWVGVSPSACLPNGTVGQPWPALAVLTSYNSTPYMYGELPYPTGEVKFYENNIYIGSAELENGYAVFPYVAKQ